MNATNDYDVIVVGGGPGGSTVAGLTAMDGHRVLLLDKDTFPRYQIGESLLPATIHGICAMLGLREEIERAGFVRKGGGTFKWGTNPEPWTFSFAASERMAGPTSYAFQVERTRFDTMLLDNARRLGAEVRQGHRVLGAVRDGPVGRVTGVRYGDDTGRERLATARFVVDASGHGSRLHHEVGGSREYPPYFRNLALFGYFVDGHRMPAPDAGNILCVAVPDGWFWYIPLSETLTSVGAVVRQDAAARVQGDPEAAYTGLIRDCPLVAEFLAGATRATDPPYDRLRVRKDYSYDRTVLWGPGMVLVGDAACFIDPVFSSGVHLATYSALLAARSINTVLRGDVDEARAFTEFERRYRAEFENFYGFLVSFYDVHQDERSYFWRARKILNTTERANEAFVRLISGFSTVESTIFETASRVSAQMKAFETSGSRDALGRIEELGRPNPRAIRVAGQTSESGPPETPRWPGGLVTSRDGFHWTTPTG